MTGSDGEPMRQANAAVRIAARSIDPADPRTVARQINQHITDRSRPDPEPEPESWSGWATAIIATSVLVLVLAALAVFT